MVRPRARGCEARTRAVGHRRRQVQQGRGRPRRQGRDAHHIRTQAVSRAPRDQRVVAKDDRTLRAAADGAAHDDHGRLFQSGLHDERCRPAPPAGAAGTATTPESMTNDCESGQARRRRDMQTKRMMYMATAAVLLVLVSTRVDAQVNAGEQKPEPTLPFAMTQVATFNLPWRIAFLPDGKLLI